MDTPVLKPTDEPSPRRRRRHAVIGAGLVAALALGVGVGYTWRSASRTPNAPASQSTKPRPPTPPAAEPGPAQSGPLDVAVKPGKQTEVAADGRLTGHNVMPVIVSVTNPGKSTSVNPLEVTLTLPTENL